MGQVVKELLADAVTYDEPYLAHAIYLHSAEDSRLYRWLDECGFVFLFQRVFKRLLNEDKASDGCHKF